MLVMPQEGENGWPAVSWETARPRARNKGPRSSLLEHSSGLNARSHTPQLCVVHVDP